MIEKAIELRQAGAHRRQLGLPGSGAAGAHDGRERAPAAPLEADEVMREALIASALESAGLRRASWACPRSASCLSCKVCAVQDLIARLPRARRALRLRAAPGARPKPAWDRRASSPRPPRMARAAAGRHRRHDPRLAHAGAERRPHPRGDRRAGDPADHGPALVHADGVGVPGLRAHHQHLLPGAGRQDPGLPARADAACGARSYPGRGGHARGGHGLRGERPGRIEARQHRHLACRARARSPWLRSTWTARRR